MSELCGGSLLTALAIITTSISISDEASYNLPSLD